MIMLGQRHTPSGLNTSFGGEGMSFAEYVEQSRAMLAQAYAALGIADCQQRILGNSPFELSPEGGFERGGHKPYRRGVLMIHGLTDSPYFMRPLAEFFREQGYRVMALLLPGHGTQPGDLSNVSWQEWVRAVEYGVNCLAEEVEDIHLAGYSAGAALSIRQCQVDDRIDGLFLFSPAIRITRYAAWANWYKACDRFLPKTRWMHVYPDGDPYKYESFPYNAAAQLHALTRQLGREKEWADLQVPVFTAASLDDTTVKAGAILRFMRNLPNPASRLILYTRDGNCPGDGDFPDGRLRCVDSAIPEQHILSAAHTSIMLPADDPHYGLKGDYSNCTHYFDEDPAKYAACKLGGNALMQGEVTPANLAHGLMRRLMYNPHFAELRQEMLQYMKSLP